jgi:hypothetical protein
VVVRNVLERQSQLFFFEYIKMMADRYHFIKGHLPHLYEVAHHGHLSNAAEFAIGSYSRYGDPAIETLLMTLQKTVELETNLELIPTYSFIRIYTTGDELVTHTDRDACEISVSLCAGGDELWPIFIEGTPIYLEPGDMVIYRGCDVTHWRNPLEGEMQAQIFLHWNDINGPHGNDNLYDGRRSMGLPYWENMWYEDAKRQS